MLIFKTLKLLNIFTEETEACVEFEDLYLIIISSFCCFCIINAKWGVRLHDDIY